MKEKVTNPVNQWGHGLVLGCDALGRPGDKAFSHLGKVFQIAPTLLARRVDSVTHCLEPLGQLL